ncbi:MAG: hypothetical protein J5621_00950 [Paludibacteraceae bacterium]|nr:hypothetical protein [Paludibacteraceae bacterium]
MKISSQQLIDEVNALSITDLPKIDNLSMLQGSYINEEFCINGNTIKLLDDIAFYWGTHIQNPTIPDRRFGIACCEQYILVYEYGRGSTNANLVLLKNRNN